MKVISAQTMNTVQKYSKKLILPAALAAGLTSCSMQKSPEQDIFEKTREVVESLQENLLQLNPGEYMSSPDSVLANVEKSLAQLDSLQRTMLQAVPMTDISVPDAASAGKDVKLQINSENGVTSINSSNLDMLNDNGIFPVDISQIFPFSNNRTYQVAIFQALPYINDGKFKQVEAMSNGFVIDGKYKMKADKNGGYRGKYDLFDSHSFKIDRLRNGNFNLIYKNDDNVEALAFSKDGKLLSKFEAFKQNSPVSPYKQPFGSTGVSDAFKSLPENTDDKIVKFNNPLSDKELNMVKNVIASTTPGIEIVDAKQDGNGLIFKYNTGDRFPEGKYTIKLTNTIGLDYKRKLDSNSSFEELKIRALENGGYACCTSNMAFFGSDYDVKYFDKDLNMKDENWYRQDKAIRDKIKKELSAAMMEKALENIKSGKPAHFKLGDNSVILLPKPGEMVIGDTSLGVRAETSFNEIREAIEDLPPAVKAGIVVVTVAAGAYALDAIVFPSFLDGAAAMGVIPASVGAAL